MSEMVFRWNNPDVPDQGVTLESPPEHCVGFEDFENMRTKVRLSMMRHFLTELSIPFSLRGDQYTTTITIPRLTSEQRSMLERVSVYCKSDMYKLYANF